MLTVNQIMAKYRITEYRHFENLLMNTQELLQLSREDAMAFLSEARLPRQPDPTDISPGTLVHPKEYGLLDRDSGTWLGNDDGPLTYDDYEIARVVARLLAARFNWSPLRIIVQRFTSASRKLDDLTPEYSLEEAWRRLDEGLTV